MNTDEAAEIICGATKDVFATMLGCDLTAGDPFENPESLYESDVTALIGLAGAMAGSVSVHCDGRQAAQFTASLLGMEREEISSQDDVRDAVGEIINMIAGNVKTALSRYGNVEIALPTVVMTPKSDIRVKGSSSIVVGFEGHGGSLFHVQLVLTEASRS